VAEEGDDEVGGRAMNPVMEERVYHVNEKEFCKLLGIPEEEVINEVKLLEAPDFSRIRITTRQGTETTPPPRKQGGYNTR